MSPATRGAAALAMVMLAACNGQVTVGVTDAPIDDAVAVTIQFEGIDLVESGGGRQRFDFDPPRRIDLLALQGGKREILLADSVPEGDYQSIRLRISADGSGDDSTLETLDGEFGLELAESDASRLTVSRSFSVSFRDSYDFTIDFDLRRSIREPLADDDPYRLVPQLRIVNAGSAGNVSGVVAASLIEDGCAPAVYAYPGRDQAPDDTGSANPPLNSGLVLLSGSTWRYAVGALPSGDYTLALTCEADDDDPATNDAIEFVEQRNVTVERGETATADF